MKIFLASDTHLDFQPNNITKLEYGMNNSDLTILAGDIHKGINGAELFPDAIQIAGNHEYYKGNFDRLNKKLENYENYLVNSTKIIGDIRIIGGTSWTDFASTGNVVMAMLAAEFNMNDYRKIRFSPSYKKITANYIALQAQLFRQFLNTELDKPFNGKTIVVTHHAPLLQSLNCRSSNLIFIDSAYANDWKEEVSRADYWFHGHTHKSTEYTYNGCRVISNPVGYYGESTGFNSKLIIEI